MLEILLKQGVEPRQFTICSCGSGVTACVIWLALCLLDNNTSYIYDGAWTEFGQTPEPDYGGKDAERKVPKKPQRPGKYVPKDEDELWADYEKDPKKYKDLEQKELKAEEK